jgi:hypothetical protein
MTNIPLARQFGVVKKPAMSCLLTCSPHLVLCASIWVHTCKCCAGA